MVFAAGVHFAEHELPVVAALLVVKIHRAAAAVVLNLDGAVAVACDRDLLAVALARLVDGVREDLENRVLAPLDAVGAEDDGRAQAHTVRAFEHRDALVIIRILLRQSDTSFLQETGKQERKGNACTPLSVLLRLFGFASGKTARFYACGTGAGLSGSGFWESPPPPSSRRFPSIRS